MITQPEAGQACGSRSDAAAEEEEPLANAVQDKQALRIIVR